MSGRDLERCGRAGGVVAEGERQKFGHLGVCITPSQLRPAETQRVAAVISPSTLTVLPRRSSRTGGNNEGRPHGWTDGGMVVLIGHH